MDDPAAPSPLDPRPRLLTRAALHGGVVGAALVGYEAALAGAAGWHARGPFFALALRGACFGLLAALVPLARLWGAPQGALASRRRRGTVALASWLALAVAGFALELQAEFALDRLAGVDAGQLSAAYVDYAQDVWLHPWTVLAYYLLFALPFSLTSLAGLSGLPRAEQLGVALVGACPLAAGVLLATSFFEPDRLGPWDSLPSAATVPVVAVALALAGKLGDRLLGPLAARGTDRRLPWGVALGCAALTPVACGAATLGANAQAAHRDEVLERAARAEGLLAAGEYANALRVCERAHELSYTSWEREALGSPWVEAAWFVGAPPPDVFQRDVLVEVFSRDRERLLARARYRLELGAFADALNDLALAFQAGTTLGSTPVLDVELYVQRAEVHACAGDPQAAREDLARAARSGEVHPDPEAEPRVRALLRD